MPEAEEDLVVIAPEEIQEEVTRDQVKDYPELGPNPATANDDVLDDADYAENPESDALEDQGLVENAAIVLGYEVVEAAVSGAAVSGAAAASSITEHQRRALALALVQKGPTRTVKRTPVGSNCNPYSRWFGFGCQFWCADFVAYCVDRSGHHIHHHAPWGYASAVSNITRWGQKNGWIRSRPRKGDIFTRKDGGHTGFVLSAQGSSFTTVEGNTSGPLGDVYVASHHRTASPALYNFVRWSGYDPA
jgi:CHAP domain